MRPAGPSASTPTGFGTRLPPERSWCGGTERDSRRSDRVGTGGRSARRPPRARAAVPARLRPNDAGGVRSVGGDPKRRGIEAFDGLAGASVDTRANAGRRCMDPRRRRADVPRRSGSYACRAAPPERGRLLPPPGSRSRTPSPRRGPPRCALDVTRLAGRRLGQWRCRRNVATSGCDCHGPALAPPRAHGTGRGRVGGGVPAAAGRSVANPRQSSHAASSPAHGSSSSFPSWTP